MQKSCNAQDLRIAIVDSHILFVDAICALFGNDSNLKITGHAGNRIGALDLARTQPDIILLEIDLGEETSLDFLPDIIRLAGGARVLIVTGVTQTEPLVRAIRLGAMGIVSKTEPAGNLFKAIRKVHGGELWVRRSILATVMKELFYEDDVKPRDAEAVKIASLTPRELEVVALLGEGLKSKHIGERLFISETTVRHHLTSIFDKLGVADRLELIIYAYQHGLARIAPAGSRPEHSKV